MDLRPRLLQQQHETENTRHGDGTYRPAVCAAMFLNLRCPITCEHSSTRCTQCGYEADDIAGCVGTFKWQPPHVCTAPNGEPEFFSQHRVQNDEALLSYVPPGETDNLEKLLRAAKINPDTAKVCKHMWWTAHQEFVKKNDRAARRKADYAPSKPATRGAVAAAAPKSNPTPRELKRAPCDARARGRGCGHVPCPGRTEEDGLLQHDGRLQAGDPLRSDGR
jgi:hypothetical protein